MAGVLPGGPYVNPQVNEARMLQESGPYQYIGVNYAPL